MQESSSSECSSVSSLSSVETDVSSFEPLEIKTIMENWEEAGEEPPTVPEDDTVPPKRYECARCSRAPGQWGVSQWWWVQGANP